MISPHTPPGTKVVFVWDPNPEESLALLAEPYRSMFTVSPAPKELVVGQAYTVVEVVPVKFVTAGFGVVIEGSKSMWSLECFNNVDLPRVITDLLETTKETENA